MIERFTKLTINYPKKILINKKIFLESIIYINKISVLWVEYNRKILRKEIIQLQFPFVTNKGKVTKRKF